jgi:hypothetical protein
MGGTQNLPVGPGVAGFLAVFALAVALWFLMRNMNSRMRRMAYRERDRLAQEQRERDEANPPVETEDGAGQGAEETDGLGGRAAGSPGRDT